MNRLAISFLCAASLVMIAGCGGGSNKAATTTTTSTQHSATATASSTETSSSSAAVAQACELVPKADAEAVMGTALQDGTPISNADVNSCTYPGDPNGPTAQFEIFVGPGAKKFFDDDSITLQHQFTDVSGLGDEAHEEDYTIFFRKGENWVALRITSLDDWSTFQSRAEKLANDLAKKV